MANRKRRYFGSVSCTDQQVTTHNSRGKAVEALLVWARTLRLDKAVKECSGEFRYVELRAGSRGMLCRCETRLAEVS